MTFRNLARVGAVGLLATGALAAAATPALAADVDFGLDLTGSTIAADASGKFAQVGVSNNGTTKPKTVGITFDVSKLDLSKVEVDLGTGGCTFVDEIAECELVAEDIPAPGASSDLWLPLQKKDGATGAAGKLTISLTVAGDADKTNNSKTVDVTVGGSGVDLQIESPDVTVVDNDGFTGKPVEPGAGSALAVYALNQGDRTARGLTVTATLPEKSSFVTDDADEECTFSGRTVTCSYDEIELIPADLDETTNKELSSRAFFFPVRVAEDAKGPALKGGVSTGVAIETAESADVRRKAAAPAAPSKNSRELTAAEVQDIDSTDNEDTFSVLVTVAEGGEGGGGGLPVTGPAALGIGAGGAAVLAAGIAMFLVARRRRIVLVAPRDEK
ncbi:hypothetical protein [Spirilliplanes yamanashiensis]|uniref:Uncharacterized protein n=1 Tax=Spirilliplanes yamanashiensis TaxID=42233 RepID=A0A8J3Y984_9ACTN|nr:hypothetical protein [Spirilliplanes yamanashiensis]MDP9815362.1 hypothetical protein [Spirilliplanes yamanashiensis]GIJ03617.1 hypothetical protein Sya03_29690 [Spirilliplanes yamanashiensis]